MEYLLFLIAGAFIAAVGWLFWALRCNDLCYKQRSTIIVAIYHSPLEKSPLYDLFDKVSYKQHCKCLEWCGDWHRLYDPKLLAVLESETKAAGESFTSAVRSHTLKGEIVP